MRGGRVLPGGDIGNSLVVALEVTLGRAVAGALCCCGIAIRWDWRWVYEISRYAGDDVCMVCMSALAGGNSSAGLAFCEFHVHHHFCQHELVFQKGAT
jgi:hypothetical protein